MNDVPNAYSLISNRRKGTPTEDGVWHDYVYKKQVVRELKIAQGVRCFEIKLAGIPVTPVGTTALRAIESGATPSGRASLHWNIEVTDAFCSTDIFIYPPYDFKIADGLITNFHVPRSSLMLLVDAFLWNAYHLSDVAKRSSVDDLFIHYPHHRSVRHHRWVVLLQMDRQVRLRSVRRLHEGCPALRSLNLYHQIVVGDYHLKSLAVVRYR